MLTLRVPERKCLIPALLWSLLFVGGTLRGFFSYCVLREGKPVGWLCCEVRALVSSVFVCVCVGGMKCLGSKRESLVLLRRGKSE